MEYDLTKPGKHEFLLFNFHDRQIIDEGTFNAFFRNSIFGVYSISDDCLGIIKPTGKLLTRQILDAWVKDDKSFLSLIDDRDDEQYLVPYYVTPFHVTVYGLTNQENYSQDEYVSAKFQAPMYVTEHIRDSILCQLQGFFLFLKLTCL